MGIHIWLVYGFIAFMSFAPFFRIDLYFKHKQYKPFFALSIVLLIWTFVTGLRLVIIEPLLIYALSLLIFPIVFLIILIFFIAVTRYLEIKIYRGVIYFLFGLFLANLGLSMTNTFHQLFINIVYSNEISILDFTNASYGFGFYVHTVISYTLLIFTSVKLIQHFYKSYKSNKDFLPLIIVIISLIFGISINIVHILFYEFTVDPTLIVFVIFVNSLYLIFIIRDVNLIFQLHNNQFILDHLREMYILVDVNGIVVDASDEMILKFKLPQEHNLTYKNFRSFMQKTSIIYKNSDDFDDTFDESKIYLHMKESRINLPLFKYSGRLFLFYNETKDLQLMHDMNYMMHHDAMTNLFNRNYFELISETIDNSTIKYTVILFDLDGLKLFNDYLGHKAGDNLLVRFSSILASVSKELKKTSPIRLGGDEFLLLMEESNVEDEERAVEMIHKMAFNDALELNIGFSYGLASKVEDKQKISDLLSQADKNMYKLKIKRKDNKRNLKIYLESRVFNSNK